MVCDIKYLMKNSVFTVLFSKVSVSFQGQMKEIIFVAFNGRFVVRWYFYFFKAE